MKSKILKEKVVLKMKVIDYNIYKNNLNTVV